MKTVFADTHYWIASANPRDSFADSAKTAKHELNNALIVTSDEVLVEFLNYFSARGEHLRTAASQIVRAIRTDPNVYIVPQTRHSFDSGHALYDRRNDHSTA